MTKTTSNDDTRYCLDRRTLLKLAGVTGASGILPGPALASPDGGSGEGSGDPAGPTPRRIEPEIPPIWREVGSTYAGSPTGRWFVEFASSPTARGGSPARHADERARLRVEARRAGVTFEEHGDFSTLWNGLSISADPADATALGGLESVHAMYPVAVVRRTATEPGGIEPQLETALAMTGADDAHALGLTGEGLSIAIVDTGIDYNHPDLGGSGDPGVVYTAADEDDRTLTDDEGDPHQRISHGWDYVGGEFDASDPDSPPPDPDPNPMDGHGHGTHVAGIAGADAASAEGVTGLAPAAMLGAYKVFAEGSTTADIIVEALEDAFEDGMNVVNMSLGASLTWGQAYPTTAASNELANQGVVVVNSAGNDAALGMWSLSAPANAHDIISVASADNTFLQALVFEVDELDDPVPYLQMDGAEAPPTTGESTPLALPPGVSIGCESADFEGFPEGAVALIERGDCFFATKYTNAVEAGASGVVIYNDVTGLFAGTILDAGVEGVWAAAISDTSGAALVDLLEAGEGVTLGFTDETISVPNPTGGLLSSFSSYGQDVELAFGPSLTAPGGLITSTWPLEQGAYALLSGTSMSAPHVAGAAALLLEAEPSLTPFDVRDRLQNTADPSLWSLAAFPGLIDHSFRQGAGMLQIDEALTATQRVTPAQIALGESPTETVTLTVTNDGNAPVTYSIETLFDTPFGVPGEGTIGASVNTFAPVFLFPGSTVDAPATVDVPANGSTSVDVSITAPGFGLPNHQYGGYLVLTPDDPALETLRVPYSGYDGDYQALDLFGYYSWPSGEPLQFVEQPPHLSRIVYDEEGEVEGFEPVEAGHEFSVPDDDFPVVEAFFGHFPQELRLTAIHQDSGEAWPVFADRYLPRSPTAEFFWPFVWLGTTRAGRSRNTRTVQSGTYALRLEALRTLGDPTHPEHLQVWESPPFELDARPADGGDEAPVGVPGRGPGGR